MEWDKRGIVWGPNGLAAWATHSALQPTPYLFDDGPLRIYAGLRAADGRSSVGFVDVDPAYPSRVLGVSKTPALAPGTAGAFDSDGVVPTAVVRDGDRLRLYYAGYLRRSDVRFQVFGGLAVSYDGGDSFERYSDLPVVPPSPEGTLFRVAHSIVREAGRWRAWYGAGSHFRQGATKTLPVYDIRYFESADGLAFPDAGTVCLSPIGDEHRVGRPWVVREAGTHHMYFGAGSEKVPYRLAFATSSDGIRWQRDDDALGLARSERGWDSQMAAYPAVIAVSGSVYLFYNGNDYGREGFGYAVRRAAHAEDGTA